MIISVLNTPLRIHTSNTHFLSNDELRDSVQWWVTKMAG